MPPKSKKSFSLETLKSEISKSTSYKEESFYSLGPAIGKLGLKGVPRGHITQVLGFSDTGKTTAMLLAIKDAMLQGDLPIIIVTEKKWDFNRLKLVGAPIEKDENTGEWLGDFIFRDDFEYVEQMTDFINDLLDRQKKGEIPYNLFFCVDSIGTLPCKMTFEGKGGKQHTAAALADKISMGLSGRITSSRKKDYEYVNSLLFINQVWVDKGEGYMAQPILKPKGGEAIFFAASLVLRFGNITNSGKTKIEAVKNGRKVLFGHKTKISIMKNHLNGLSFDDVKIISVPHGYIEDDKKAQEDYKKQYSSYWQELLQVGDVADINFDEEYVEDVNELNDDE